MTRTGELCCFAAKVLEERLELLAHAASGHAGQDAEVLEHAAVELPWRKTGIGEVQKWLP